MRKRLRTIKGAGIYSAEQLEYAIKVEKELYTVENVLRLLSEVSPNGAEEVIEEAETPASSSNSNKGAIGPGVNPS
jgi:hypothetical protein